MKLTTNRFYYLFGVNVGIAVGVLNYHLYTTGDYKVLLLSIPFSLFMIALIVKDM